MCGRAASVLQDGSVGAHKFQVAKEMYRCPGGRDAGRVERPARRLVVAVEVVAPPFWTTKQVEGEVAGQLQGWLHEDLVLVRANCSVMAGG